ncbi:TRAP transporter small permease [Algihabitans albus]|uniref:TRAP transporter small permease n=1 Tax=Algihabitans albus TaxID=2164067 RepID=UPI000E5C783C|nr:TRAP transporter small permease [Algihabitans albus]
MSRARTPFARVIQGFERALDIAVGSLLVVIVSITLAQVFSRYVLGSSLIWSSELVRLLHVWLIMLAAAKVGHMRITILTDALPVTLRRAADWVVLAVSLGCLGLLFYGGLSIWTLLRNDTYSGLPLSPGLLFLAVAVGSALWALASIARAVDGGNGEMIDPAGPVDAGSDRHPAAPRR